MEWLKVRESTVNLFGVHSLTKLSIIFSLYQLTSPTIILHLFHENTGANLVSVKVLAGIDGSGSTSSVIAGIDWVVKRHTSSGNRLSVANLSLGGSFSQSLNQVSINQLISSCLIADAAQPTSLSFLCVAFDRRSKTWPPVESSLRWLLATRIYRLVCRLQRRPITSLRLARQRLKTR
jgi:hypothetical protein